MKIPSQLIAMIYTNHHYNGRGVLIYVVKNLRVAEVEMENLLIDSVWTNIKLTNHNNL